MYLIIFFFISAFLFLYLRGKEKETHPKKKKPRNSSHHPHFVRLSFFYFGLRPTYISLANSLRSNSARQFASVCVAQ